MTTSSATVAPATAQRGMGGVYQPQLDGLRALAILGVLFHHYGLHIPEFFEYGPISVRLFFALTGYFITLWLWKAEDAARAGGMSVWRALPVFHGRRLLRIVPPLYLSLLIAVVLGFGEVRSSLGWHLAFLSNFHVVRTGYWPPVTSHLWSLSVQEQFYLLWPVVVLLTPRKWFLPVLAGALVAAFAYRLGCVLGDINPVVRWTMVFGSLDSFATGAFVAWLGRGRLGNIIMTNPQRWGFGIFAVFCLLVARWLRYFPQTDPWVATIELWEAVFIGWVIAATTQGWPGWFGRLLSWPPLVYVGKISLGIYLYHILVHILLGPALDGLGITPAANNTLRVWILAACSIGAAALSWHWLEKPLSKLKPRMAR
ncbi:MAG: acyltransferase family protein [Chthoniobacterales bacterium]|jgi:peptidoglycan/LPS O-acetylase OafA/YrhL